MATPPRKAAKMIMTKTEIKEIKENHPNAQIKCMSSYGKVIDFNENFCFIGAKYNPRTNELIFMADARKIK